MSAVFIGCTTDSSSPDSTGGLSLDLTIADDVVINEVSWTITGGDMEPMRGTIDTSAQDSTASLEVFGLPPGSGYLVEFEATDETGTVITFKPDHQIFPELVFNYETLRSRLRELAFLNRGVRISITDDRGEKPRSETFHYEGGIVEYVRWLNEGRAVICPEPIFFDGEKDGIQVAEEGCLSVPGYYETVRRAERVTEPSDPLVRWVVQVGSFTELARADALVTQLREAGLADVACEEVAVHLPVYASPEKAAELALAIGPAARATRLFEASSGDKAAIQDDIARDLEQYHDGTAVRIPALLNLYTARVV